MKRLREDETEHVAKAAPENSIYPDAGKWVRGRLLGRGGFGSVHLATIIEPGSRLDVSGFSPVMAVKSTPKSRSTELENEKQHLQLFAGNPHIIRCFGDDVTITSTADQGNIQTLNLFLEYASGGSLADMIKNTNEGLGLRESQVRRYTESILRGIHCIHKMGKVHCDLKPANILLVKEDERDDDFVAKIADFGLAKKADDWEALVSARGTRMYLAPECVMIDFQEQYSDIWALGCIVLGMLTGRYPWDANLSKKELDWKIQHERPFIPSSNSISKDAEDFLIKCFQKDPDDRPSAAMLLSHPFVCGPEIIDLTSEEEEEDPSEEEEEAEEDSCVEVNIPHPRHKRPAFSRPIFCPKPLALFTIRGAA
ncbi:Serine/threonine protein kinase [Trema orientale]|uniref:Serine/threonine protein kinase n=1 Tax=Trema orientale TaxID=63057 RepID=A0A2P5EQ73_TREOI|nr:Serine/threonine protein kinase [Trema orientale]